MALPTVTQITVTPENDPSGQTKTELKTTILYRIGFTGPPFSWQGFGATDGTTTVPTYGEELEIGGDPTGMFVTNVVPQRGPDKCYIDVYVTFSTLGDNPTQTGKWNTSIKVSGVKFTETTTRYYPTTANPAGKIIVNSAGDQYDPLKVRTLTDGDRHWLIEDATRRLADYLLGEAA